MQDGHPIAFKCKKLCGTQLQWLIHEKELYVVVCCLKMWQHYLGMHETKVFMDNISLKYFETQPRSSTKQLKWHDTLALLDMELIHKQGQDNVVPNAPNRKEEFQVEKPLTKIQTLKAIFQKENNLRKKIKKSYMQDPLAQHHFKELHERRKVKGITLKEGLFKWKKF
jgi:hypothetical protein